MIARYTERLAALVGLDRGSRSLPGLDAAAVLVAGWLAEAGADVKRVPIVDRAAPGDVRVVPVAAGLPLGDAVVGRWRGSGSGRVLLAGHLDTVFADGTAAARPFSIDGSGIARGPGVCDDAGGLLAGIAALEALDGHVGEVVLVATPDEEIGSPGSRALLAELGAEADVVLGLECARADGSLVSGRKGVADIVVRLHGRAAHAGIEPGAGRSAALAAARLALAFDELNDGDVTVNTGVLRAGERANVVAASAELRAELRSSSLAGFDAALRRMTELAGTVGVAAELAVEAPVPPWRATAGTRRLLALARSVGAEAGVKVRDVETGGCGDANLLAQHCDAVLDGLGPVGGGDHSEDEYLDLLTVPARVALLAGLIARLHG